MKQSLLAILFLVCPSLFAQHLVTGIVVDNVKNEPVERANVIVKNASNRIVTYTTSKADGTFALTLDDTLKHLTINVSILGFMPYSSPLSENKLPLYIKLEESTTQLKDVAVKALKIREQGDTLTYNVSSFAKDEDYTIGDVLKRMPGINVDKSGKITYQGTDINKFYIESGDMLGGMYGIATNGISHDDVAAVDVMENHQPMQVLSGLSFSDQAAINLRLKNSKNAVLILNGHAGGGWSEQPEGAVWNGELLAMTVMRNFQTLNTQKSNNIGTDLRSELTDFFASRKETDLKSYFSVSLPTTPSLDEKRTLFNRSHSFSSNNLWRLKKVELKAQVDYFRHRATSDALSETTYFLPDGTKFISEKRNGIEHANRLTASFTAEANQKRYFLNNTLRTELNWNDITTSTTGTIPNTQTADLPDYYVANSLKVIKRFGNNHLITFTSKNEYESMPQKLTVVRESKSISNPLAQDIKTHAFFSDEKVKYGFILNRFNISLEGGIGGYLRKMTNCDTETNYFKLYASPEANYSLGDFEFTANYPMEVVHYILGEILGRKDEYFHSPSLRIRWSPIGGFSLSLRGGAGRTPLSLANIYNGSILTNYRTTSIGADQLYINTRKNMSLTMTYRNASSGFFGYAIAMKGWNTTPYRQAQRFDADMIIYSYLPQTTDDETTYFMANIGKTINAISGGISLDGSMIRSKSQMMSEDVLTHYKTCLYSLNAKVYTTIARMLTLDYALLCDWNSLTIDEGAKNSTVSLRHDFRASLTPVEKWTFSVGGELYRNEITENNFKNMLMLDARVSWRASKKIELQASLNNILNKNEYSYTSYGTLSAYSQTLYLRGREFLITLYLKK